MRFRLVIICAILVMSGSSSLFSASEKPRHPAFRERIADRNHMVFTQMRDVTDVRTLEAMRTIPRHSFVPVEMRSAAYDDHALPIGYEQTISQPYVVAYMTSSLKVQPGQRVLELGTGSGYQAAVLAELGAEVYSVEIVPELAADADSTLAALGYTQVHVKQGDGYAGWPEYAPFDRILVTFAVPDSLPEVEAQLAKGGLMILPLDSDRGYQRITILHKDENGKISLQQTKSVLFVPMTGEHAR
jgi:protein-L-isoaspartate(D-aspartate) O-methyltransferase